MKKEIEERPKLTVSRNVSAEELLSFLVESGQLDLESAEDELRTNEMNSILEKHKLCDICGFAWLLVYICS